MSATQAAATIPNNLREESTNEAALLDKTTLRQDWALERQLALTGTPVVRDAKVVTEREKKDRFYRENIEHPFNHGPWASETAKENELPFSQQNRYQQYQQNSANPGGYVGNYEGFPAPSDLTMEQLSVYGVVVQPIPPVQAMRPLMPGMPIAGQPGMIMGEPDRFPGLPEDWPDPRGFIPEGPKPERPVGKEKNEGPIISWVNVYNSKDAEFMQALEDYDFTYCDDKRLNSKQTILSNRSEFIAFCCRMHIWEIFSARGGAGPAEKISRVPKPWRGP
jgi:hypothetical protein